MNEIRIYLIIDLIIGLLCGFWMYRDAKAKNLQSPVQWVWVGVLFGLLGLIGF